MAVSAAESPRLFSFRVPVSPGLAQPQRALRLLAAHQVDRTHLALSLFRPELRPDPRQQAAWWEVDGRQVVHSLFRLAAHRVLDHPAAWQVGRSPVVLVLLRRAAHAQLGRLAVVCPARLQRFCRDLALEYSRELQFVLEPVQSCLAADRVRVAAAMDGRTAPVS